MKSIHTGYAGRATGGYNRKLESEVTALVEKLLAGKAAPARVQDIQVARDAR